MPKINGVCNMTLSDLYPFLFDPHTCETTTQNAFLLSICCHTKNTNPFWDSLMGPFYYAAIYQCPSDGRALVNRSIRTALCQNTQSSWKLSDLSDFLIKNHLVQQDIAVHFILCSDKTCWMSSSSSSSSSSGTWSEMWEKNFKKSEYQKELTKTLNSINPETLHIWHHVHVCLWWNPSYDRSTLSALGQV